jgi:hypothetical protein
MSATTTATSSVMFSTTTATTSLTANTVKISVLPARTIAANSS